MSNYSVIHRVQMVPYGFQPHANNISVNVYYADMDIRNKILGSFG